MDKLYIKEERHTPHHQNCLTNAKKYMLFEKEAIKLGFSSGTMDVCCCDYVFSAKRRNNPNQLVLWIPQQKKILHEIDGKESIAISPEEYRVVNTFQISKPMVFKKEKCIKIKTFSFSCELINNVLERLEISKSAESLEFGVSPTSINKLMNAVFTILEESFKNNSQEDSESLAPMGQAENYPVDSESSPLGTVPFGYPVDNHIVIETAALQIITLLLKYHSNNFQGLSKDYKLANHPAIKRALNYIRDNYNKSISLDDIAFTSCLNKTYMVELFTKETGQTPFQYIRNYRIEKAKELIKKHKFKIEQIASETGFKDERHFRRLFKQITGYSTSYYK